MSEHGWWDAVTTRGEYATDCGSWVWWLRHPFYNLRRVYRVRTGYYS